jgi:small subunit ribosomal protein S9
VRIYPSAAEEKGIVVNEKEFEKYFPIARLREVVKSPLALAGQGILFDVTVKVKGGGVNAQAEAIRLGISRALVVFNEELRKSMRDRGFLTRDSRIVERKKAGLKKARKSPQWAKR